MPQVTACATLGYAACNVETACERIARRGFHKVEITELGSYCRHYPFREADRDRFRRLLDRCGLRAVAMNVSDSRKVDGATYRPRLANPKEAEATIAMATWFLDEAAALGIPIVSFPIGPRLVARLQRCDSPACNTERSTAGRCGQEGDWQSEMRAAVAGYRRIADLAAARGVRLSLEVPHLYQLTDSVEHVLAIFRELERPAVGATVDSSHWGILRYDLGDFFQALGPRLAHVHLRDSAGGDTRDFRQNLELTPGRGSVDFAAFGRALDRAGYRGEVSLELEHRHDELDRIEQEYDTGIAHLRACGWSFPDRILTAKER
ncbi:MAG: sugar phosphate isomerase/epimerase [Lentisphaerae bacterium]|nr:sugar phosphate isomerase/epimerase [Lentisphaerota bacterium]